jgi:hypothetical protein
MFDMRYHIASLVAVFLALTVGLLLGSLIVDKGLMANQQERLLNSIRADVNRINEKNQRLQSEVNGLRDFQKQVLPITVQNRLVDTSVTIVTLMEGQDELVNEVDKTLTEAGAGTCRLQIKMKSINVADAGFAELLREPVRGKQVDGNDMEKLFWPRFVAEMSGAESPKLLGELTEAGLVTAESSDMPIGKLVVLAANDRTIGSRDTLFLDSLSEIEGARVITVEASNAKPSRIGAYKLRNVSTIDNIDTVPGKISLVYLLAAEDKITAHFGQKTSADKLIP